MELCFLTQLSHTKTIFKKMIEEEKMNRNLLEGDY